MKRWILHIFDFLSARKGLAAAIWTVLLALCVCSALRLDFQEDISAFLPGAEDLQEETRGQERMALLFEGGTLEQRIEAMYAFEDRWAELDTDIPISAQADQGELLDVFRFLSANWPYFLQEADYARMDSLLQTPGYVREALHRDKVSLYNGNALQTLYLRSDPLGLYSPVLKRFQALQPSTRLEDGCLFTGDGEAGVIFFTSPYGGSESGRNARLMEQLRTVREAVAGEFPQVQISSTGGPEVAVENASRIKKDSIWALVMAALLISIVLWFSYKRLADVLWILISIATGALIALGIIALFKSAVSVIILGMGCTIIGIAVNYPLHYVDHLKYQQDKRKALSEQVTPLLVGNITTVGAFLSMLLLKAEALRDFGFIGAMMLVGTILFVLLLLPVFVPAAQRPRSAVKLDFDRHIKAGPEARRAFFLLFLLLSGFLFWQSRKVGFDADLHHINYMTPEQAHGFAVLESLQPGKAAAIADLDRPSQEAAIARWNAFWAAHPEVADQLIDAGLQEGFTAHAFQPFFDALDTRWEPQPERYFAPVTQVDQAARLSARLVQALSEDFDTIGLLCSLIVFCFLWMSFGALELALIAFLPLAVSWFWIEGIMGLSGLQFNIVNVILATFIFGQGDDYTIFITEGLLYERANGKKILHSYKNAVVLSALIMFIGIGVLAFAKHPAMRSLGQVTVIGMLTVVLMAYYLPPLLFRWLTQRRGEPRKAPVTLIQGLRTLYISLMMLVTMTLLSLICLFFPPGLAFHKLIQKVASWAIRHIPGCPYTLLNPHGEDFSKPAIYVCNHQSHFDVLALMALQPKLIFMTNDWVWRFPLYGAVLRKAWFFPASWGLSQNSAHMKRLVAQGYSIVIFPEGTRSLDGEILRFHRGAFHTAGELGLDILPLCLHGFSQALPKHDFLLRKTPICMEIGKRIAPPAPSQLAAFTRDMRHFYQNWYADLRRRREDAAYWAFWVRRQYLYKGQDALLECRRVLRKENIARIDALSGPAMKIRRAGCGVEALLIARTHPSMQITAYEADEEKYLTAIHCDVPKNLKYVHE